MIAWGMGSKAIMTGIGLSPSYLTPIKIPLMDNWHPLLMKWFGTWWSFPINNRLDVVLTIMIWLAQIVDWPRFGWLHLHLTCVIIRFWAIEIPSLTHHDIMVDIEKMVLTGSCNLKFSLTTSLFVVNTHTIIKTSLFWHIYGSDTFFSKLLIM